MLSALSKAPKPAPCPPPSLREIEQERQADISSGAASFRSPLAAQAASAFFLLDDKAALAPSSPSSARWSSDAF